MIRKKIIEWIYLLIYLREIKVNPLTQILGSIYLNDYGHISRSDFVN
jgi:hypothetical protein